MFERPQAEDSGRAQRRASRAAFARSEALEMRRSRGLVLLQSLPWALVGAAVGGALAWFTALALGEGLRLIGSEWSAPPTPVCLLIGVAGGAGGAFALACLLRSFFEEDRDVPAVVVPALAACTIATTLYGAGLGRAWQAALGLAVGLPLGLLAGVFAYFLYWAVSTAALALRDTARGY